jgi:kanamycin kinase
MKKRKINSFFFDLPEELKLYTSGAELFDTSCSENAKVYYINKDEGYYLKYAPHVHLESEAMMTDYFHKKGFAPEVLFYRIYQTHDILLTRALPGDDCTAEKYLSEPIRLAEILGENLRILHQSKHEPYVSRTENYLRFAKMNFNAGKGDLSAFPEEFPLSPKTLAEAGKIFKSEQSAFKKDVLIHGDYCLPNIILNKWDLSGYIDLGSAGGADRHIDLFWGIWSLWYNLKTYRYTDRFLDAYGRDKVDNDMLRIVCATEVFG